MRAISGVFVMSLLACAAPRPDVVETPQPPTETVAPQGRGGEHAHHVTAAPADAADLERELEQLRQATARYRDHRNAVADGFKRFGQENALMGEHWYRDDLVQAPLDLTRPSTLQYATIDGRRVLVGVAYTTYQRPDEPVPTGFAGNTDHWHVHDVTKIAQAATQDRPLLRWLVNRRAERGKLGAGDGRTHLVMVHAWPWLENPDGMFAQQHRSLPYLRLGLPAWFAPRADLTAAQGIALLTTSTCERELQRIEMLARPDRRQQNELAKTCSNAAAQLATSAEWRVVRGRRFATEPEADSTPHVDRLNAAAAAAWRTFEAARNRILTPEQRRRLESAIEHPAVMH